MSTNPDEPNKLSETEAKAGSKTKANQVVLIVSTVAIIIAFVVVYLIYA